jgi:5'-deoxy-5'-methylthioadenosine phosphorylase
VERLGIIGGSGLTRLQTLEIERQEVVRTPFGEPSAPFSIGKIDDISVVFLPRHGAGHSVPPHRVNYRANIWAMNALGIQNVIGVAAVGGITQPPGVLCIPHQIVDYTWGRAHTFYDSDLEQVIHVDLTEPYCESLRGELLAAGARQGLPMVAQGTYGATQGPRLESAAEIVRLERDGCDLVGMTGMPEAALARELGLCYACCAVVVNWAAGKRDGPITMHEIEANLVAGMENARRLLGAINL